MHIAHACQIQALDGEDGARAADGAWPAFHRSTAHTSPLAHDVDYDGVLDLLIATYDGEILAIRDTARLDSCWCPLCAEPMCATPCAASRHARPLPLAMAPGGRLGWPPAN